MAGFTKCFAQIHDVVEQFAKDHTLLVEMANSQRILRPKIWLLPVPPPGTEVFISKIPPYIFEDFLIPYFAKMGIIYKFRLMLSVSYVSSRGFAYVTYSSVESADLAIQALNGTEIIPGHRISVQKSNDNKRLFVGGIPEAKTKDDVWRELMRVGVQGIVDVIMYRSYSDRNKNRGFVFVEFQDHQNAALVRSEFKNLMLWGERIQVDWSKPLPEVDPMVMTKVKKLFLRNLSVDWDKEMINSIIKEVHTMATVEKVYKYRDYAFVHYQTRRDAQKALHLLRDFFSKYSPQVEVTWAKPPPPSHHERYSPDDDDIAQLNANLETNLHLHDRRHPSNLPAPPFTSAQSMASSPIPMDSLTLSRARVCSFSPIKNMPGSLSPPTVMARSRTPPRMMARSRSPPGIGHHPSAPSLSLTPPTRLMPNSPSEYTYFPTDNNNSFTLADIIRKLDPNA